MRNALICIFLSFLFLVTIGIFSADALAFSGSTQPNDVVCGSHAERGTSMPITEPDSSADVEEWLKALPGIYAYGALTGLRCATMAISVNNEGKVTLHHITDRLRVRGGHTAPYMWLEKATVKKSRELFVEKPKWGSLTVEPIKNGIIRITRRYEKNPSIPRSLQNPKLLVCNDAEVV
jgi:hypothetical protein